MKDKKVLFIIAAILVAAIAFACGILFAGKTKKEEPKKQEETKEEVKEDLANYSYLPITYKVCDEDSCLHVVGSFHLGDKRIRKVDQRLLDIFDESDYLALEIKDEANIGISDFMIKDGTTIEDKVSPELYAKLQKFSEEHPSYNLESYKRFTLGMNANAIEGLPFAEAGYKTKGIDDLFHNRANRMNKEVLAFETAAFQVNLLTGYSDTLYAGKIEYMIDNYDELKRTYFDLLEVYLKGDVEGVKKQLEAEEAGEEGVEPTQEEIDYYNAMYTNRNNNMTAVIKGYLAENKNVFVVVGAAHVIADDGIIAQLKETNNYTITRFE